MRLAFTTLFAFFVLGFSFPSNTRAQSSCPTDLSGRIIQNGYSAVTCLPGVPGSGITDTLAIKDITSYGTRYGNAELWPANQDPNTPTVRTWAPIDFDIAGIGPQNVFSVSISPADGDIYTASTRLWGEPAAPGSIGALLTPGPLGVYRIDGTTGAVSLIVNITADVNVNENFGASYVTFDETTNQVFTVGMDTGTIYRIDPNGSGAGAVLQAYNPDIDGAVAEDTVASELVPRGERILGLAWNPGDRRLYYSVWVVDTEIENNALPNTVSNTIRSVALDAANAIDPATDRLEIAMPFIDVVQEDNLNPPATVSRTTNYSNPVADIEFNHDGTRVLLSEQGYDSSFPASWAHRSRLLEYGNSGGTWTLVGNQSRYGMGESFFFDPGPPNPPIQYEGINARGGAAWAYESITPPRAVGRDDFMLATADALILRADVFYGYQFMPTTTAGNVYSSLIADLDGDPAAFAKGLFGDVDVFMCAFDVGNRVWLDVNANGIQDGSENGVPNVLATLHLGTGCANPTAVTATTDVSGLYNFPDILSGQYSIQFSNLPAGVVVSPADQGGDDAQDSDANATACIEDVTVTQSNDSFDMGIYFPTGSIAVTKTVTGNAAPNPWAVTITSTVAGCALPAPYDTNPTLQTADGSGGTVTFAGLPVDDGAGTTCAYDVAVTPQASYTDTTTDTLTGLNVTDGGTTAVEATCTQDPPPVGSIAVTKTVTGNAAPNPWAITITSTVAGCALPAPFDTNPTLQTADGSGGTVTFAGLPVDDGAGTTCAYDVAVTPQAGYTDTTTDTLTGLNVTDGGTTSVEATCSENPPLVGSIAVTKTVTGNTAPSPWAITITSTVAGCTLPAPFDTNPTLQTADGSGGTVTFAGLLVDDGAGTTCAYDVAVTPQAGYTDTTTDTLTGLNVTDGGTTSVGASCTADPRFQLGDFVWYDNDQNGRQDSGEPGVENVIVDLYDNGTCTGVPIANDSTDASGLYLFTGLLAGNYCVAFTLPAGWVVTLRDQGGNDTADSDADPITAQIDSIVLNADDLTEDVGIYAPIGSVDGLLFCDNVTANGQPDMGEEVAGVDVSLLRDTDCNGTGDTVVQTQMTAADGSYLFGSLAVAFAPAPPNPEVCYVIDVDLAAPALSDCNEEIVTAPPVTLTTTTPNVTGVLSGVRPAGTPQPIPVNSPWTLLTLCLLLMLIGGVSVEQNRGRLRS